MDRPRETSSGAWQDRRTATKTALRPHGGQHSPASAAKQPISRLDIDLAPARPSSMSRRLLRAGCAGAALVASLLLKVEPANAGAPNYECRAGSVRIGIDQHRHAALIREGPELVQQASFVDGGDGGPLGLMTVPDGARSTVTVDGSGSSMTYSPSIGPQTSGACAFVPGSYILGQVTGKRVYVRSGPSMHARLLVTVGRRGLIWSYGRYLPSNTLGPKGWTRVRVVTTLRGGTSTGGEQAIGMAADSGLDGRSSIVDGWARVDGLSFLENVRSGQ